MVCQLIARLLQCFLCVKLSSSFVFDAQSKGHSLFLSRTVKNDLRPTFDASILRQQRRPLATLEMGEGDTEIRPSIHPMTINAIAKALNIRGQNQPNMPLRLTDDMDPMDIMMASGKIAQEAIQTQQKESQKDGVMMTDEEQQVAAGRIITIVRRFADLEAELYSKCEAIEWIGKHNEWNSFGLLQDETDSKEVDEKILDDTLFAMNRAECLLAIFLETIESPGLRSNGVTIPCMNVDFLDSKRYDALFADQSGEEDEQKETAKKEEGTQGDEQIGDPLREATGIRPSLHPITINAIVEALKIRAQNMTTSPLRIIDDNVEWFEVQLAAGKIAERTVAKRQKAGGQDGMTLTEEEAQTVGGRITAVLMRLEDLEWELNHRCKGESWISKFEEWDNFGILKDESCIKTLDERILEDPLFAMNRAERLLALFLLNLEKPGMEAGGATVPGGSDVDFLEDDHYRIMMPKEVVKPSS